MMSQSRQSDIDCKDAKHDYEVNLKAELEIELLHDKINALRQKEIPDYIGALQTQLQVQQQQHKRLEKLLQSRS